MLYFYQRIETSILEGTPQNRSQVAICQDVSSFKKVLFKLENLFLAH